MTDEIRKILNSISEQKNNADIWLSVDTVKKLNKAKTGDDPTEHGWNLVFDDGSVIHLLKDGESTDGYVWRVLSYKGYEYQKYMSLKEKYPIFL